MHSPDRRYHRVRLGGSSGALLTETQEPFLPQGKQRDVGVGVALLATNLQMFVGQMEIEASMFEPGWSSRASQYETAPVGNGKLLAMVLRMAFRTILDEIAGDCPVETGPLRELSFNVFMATLARLGHRLSIPSVARLTILRSREPGMLLVHHRDFTGR